MSGASIGGLICRVRVRHRDARVARQRPHLGSEERKPQGPRGSRRLPHDRVWRVVAGHTRHLRDVENHERSTLARPISGIDGAAG
jgi:hypothetical protein